MATSKKSVIKVINLIGGVRVTKRLCPLQHTPLPYAVSDEWPTDWLTAWMADRLTNSEKCPLLSERTCHRLCSNDPPLLHLHDTLLPLSPSPLSVCVRVWCSTHSIFFIFNDSLVLSFSISYIYETVHLGGGDEKKKKLEPVTSKPSKPSRQFRHATRRNTKGCETSKSGVIIASRRLALRLEWKKSYCWFCFSFLIFTPSIPLLIFFIALVTHFILTVILDNGMVTHAMNRVKWTTIRDRIIVSLC